MKKKYILIKDKKSNKNFHMTYDKINGFKIKPKKDLKYDGVKVDKMVLINPSFIEQVIKKKVKHKLDIYLQYLITVLDDDGTGTTDLRHALNDLTRYKQTIMNNYRIYLDEKYIALLMKKISLIEHELQMKFLVREYNNHMYYEDKNTNRRTR